MRLLCDVSGGADCGVALFAGEFTEGLDEGDEAGVRGLGEGEEPAIADP
jgi:hypothetical protein